MSRAVITRISPPGKTTKDYESQATIERFAEGNVSLLAGSPDLVATGKDLLDFVWSEVVLLDMEDIVAVPLEPRGEHMAIGADCIYKALQKWRLERMVAFQALPKALRANHPGALANHH